MDTPPRITAAVLTGLALANTTLGTTEPGTPAPPETPWVEYQGVEGPGKGKMIVLVSGDEEYRSEEALPMLGKILAAHHGFDCRVVFAIDPETGEINPNNRTNIPGLEALEDADLMIIATRFRALPDEQMVHIDNYLKSGRPVFAIRTATHAFNFQPGSTYHNYTWNNNGGFGRQILGETWVDHHGGHGTESTRGIIAPGAGPHPIARGLDHGTVWGPTDVYRINLPMPEGCVPIVLGQVLEGMNQGDNPVSGPKNNPLMPIAWTRTFDEPGKPNRVFTSTLGSSTDLVAEGSRRMFVNAVYWTMGLEDHIPAAGTAVDIVGEFNPTQFAFDGFIEGVKPSDHAWEPGDE